MDCNYINAHERDSRICFDAESHTYTIRSSDGMPPVVCDSVTTIVEDCFEQFDADYWAERKATPQKPASVLKAEWAARGKAARDLGTQLHDRIERYYLCEQLDNDALADRAFGHFLAFALQTDVKPYRTEWRIFSERYRVAGTLDFLAFDGSSYEIYDWKRSSKLIGSDGRPVMTNAWGKTGLGLMSHLPDTTYHHYALQVSMYRYILELEYGINVCAGHLGTFHPDYPCHYVIDLPYLREEVADILESRIV